MKHPGVARAVSAGSLSCLEVMRGKWHLQGKNLENNFLHCGIFLHILSHECVGSTGIRLRLSQPSFSGVSVVILKQHLKKKKRFMGLYFQ